MSFLQSIDNGRLGLNQGLPNGITGLDKYIYGTQKGRIYLFGGESGTGKTTLVDYMGLFSPYRFMKQQHKLGITCEIHWEYYSFEQGRKTKETSWASKMIFDRTGKRLPVSYIMSKGKNRVSDEDYQLCIAVDGELKEMFEHINMVDVPIGPNKFKDDLFRYGTKHGTWQLKDVLDKNGKPKLHSKTQKVLKEVIGWMPNNPHADHIFIMDHIAYAALEMPTLKQNIDMISRTAVQFRELCGWTFFFVQQFNTELASVERQKFKKSALAPQRVDFGDSRYTYQDADVVFGLLNPYSYDIPEFHGYKTEQMLGYAIWIFLMKNRHDGPPGRVLPLFMDPVGGTFEELPEAASEGMLAMGLDDPIVPFYQRAQEFNQSIQLYDSI